MSLGLCHLALRDLSALTLIGGGDYSEGEGGFRILSSIPVSCLPAIISCTSPQQTHKRTRTNMRARMPTHKHARAHAHAYFNQHSTFISEPEGDRIEGGLPLKLPRVQPAA